MNDRSSSSSGTSSSGCRPRSVHALILAGGAGTRFWPASRQARPKQLLPLTGGESLIVETVRRILPLSDWSRIWIATGKHLATETCRALPEVPHGNLLIEPVPRNTAPCIGWAAARLARTDPDSVLMVLPSDHYIALPEKYREVVDVAIRSAAAGNITTIGIRPTHAETGFGYIEVDSDAKGGMSGAPLHVAQFVEKPNKERAEAFVAGGKHYWNAGMFFFRPTDMLEAIRVHLPELAAGLVAMETGDVDAIFPTLPAVSIDHGVMEKLSKSKNLAVVPGDFGWSDVGSWHSAWELGAKDSDGNCAPPGAVLVGAHRNHVVDLRTPRTSGERVVTLVGVNDLVVVETDDALLVVPRERAQDVRLVVEALKKRGGGRFL